MPELVEEKLILKVAKKPILEVVEEWMPEVEEVLIPLVGRR